MATSDSRSGNPWITHFIFYNFKKNFLHLIKILLSDLSYSLLELLQKLLWRDYM